MQALCTYCNGGWSRAEIKDAGQTFPRCDLCRRCLGFALLLMLFYQQRSRAHCTQTFHVATLFSINSPFSGITLSPQTCSLIVIKVTAKVIHLFYDCFSPKRVCVCGEYLWLIDEVAKCTGTGVPEACELPDAGPAN